MNKISKKYLALLCGVMVTISGCGGGSEAPAEETTAAEATVEESAEATAEESAPEEAAEETAETEEAAEEETADADETEEAAEETEEAGEEATELTELPAYEYPDKISPYFEVYRYLVEEIGGQYDKADVCIPYGMEIDMDMSDTDDIKVYGDFWVYNYDLNGDTLEAVSGGDFPGVMHLKQSDSDYEVTSFDVVEDGNTFDSSAKELFGDYYDKLIEAMSDEETREIVRKQFISDYVLNNNLPITQYQDYGWDPVSLADDEEEYDGPEDFLQEQSGKTEFENLDDVIANLKPGQGYAKIQLYGCDVDILAVTDTVFEADNSAAEAALYTDIGSGAYNLTLVTGNGSSYPLRYEDGIIYGGDNHEYISYFAYENEDTVGVMVKDCVSDGDGAGEYSGFLREENSFDNDTEFTGGQEEFEAMLAEREEKPVLEFTVVE